MRGQFFGALLAVSSLVSAQNQSQPPRAACDASYSWAFNSKNQSPCEVAESLGGVCNAGQFSIAAIGPGQFYSGPLKETVTECRCSSVFYSMLSACAACQSRNWLQWSQYNANCSTVYPGIFPRDLPSPVPAYGFQNVTASNVFNMSEAFNLVSSGASESSSVNVPTPTALPSMAPAATSTQPTAGSSKSNAGAIAGGVVGGVAFIALVAGVLFWYRRKHRRDRETLSYTTSQKGLTSVTPYAIGSPATGYTSQTLPVSSPYTGSSVTVPQFIGSPTTLERRASSPEI